MTFPRVHTIPVLALSQAGQATEKSDVERGERETTPLFYRTHVQQPRKAARRIGLRDMAPPLATAMFYLAQQHCSSVWAGSEPGEWPRGGNCAATLSGPIFSHDIEQGDAIALVRPMAWFQCVLDPKYGQGRLSRSKGPSFPSYVEPISKRGMQHIFGASWATIRLLQFALVCA